MRFSRRRIGAFARVLGAEAGEYFDPVSAGYDGYRDVIAPAVFAVVPGQLQQNDLLATIPAGSVPLLHGVHITMSQPIVAGVQLAAQTEVTQRRSNRPISALTTQTTIFDDAGQQLVIVTQKLALVSENQPQPKRDSATPPKGSAQNDEGGRGGPNRVILRHFVPDSESVKDGPYPVILRAVAGSRQGEELRELQLELSQRELAAYVTVSDDGNPVHTDASYAQNFGYQAPVAQGMLMLGKAISQIEAELGHYVMPKQIQARFIAPVEVPPAGTSIIVQQHQNELTFYHQNQRVARATYTL